MIVVIVSVGSFLGMNGVAPVVSSMSDVWLDGPENPLHQQSERFTHKHQKQNTKHATCSKQPTDMITLTLCAFELYVEVS